jgi:hypothetical protein
MKRLRTRAVAAGGACSETPIFDIDARQESMEKEGRVTIMASRTVNHLDPGAILNGGALR